MLDRSPKLQINSFQEVIASEARGTASPAGALLSVGFGWRGGGMCKWVVARMLVLDTFISIHICGGGALGDRAEC